MSDPNDMTMMMMMHIDNDKYAIDDFYDVENDDQDDDDDDKDVPSKI